MEFSHFTAGEDDAERRLDRILRRLLPQKTLTSVYAALRRGLIKLNGKKARADDRVAKGDRISLARILLDSSARPNGAETAAERTCAAENPNNSKNTHTDTLHGGLPVIFKNEFLCVINKPYGIPVQGGSGQSIASLIAEGAEIGSTSLSFRPAPLHRLDRATTGILVCSQNLAGARWFSRLLADRCVHKEYLAIAEGRVKEGELCSRLIRSRGRDGFYRSEAAQKGKEALSMVRPLACASYKGREVSLILVSIKTGRAHQIRAQLSHAGHPLLGDTAYGAAPIEGKQRLFLHALRLSVLHPNPCAFPQCISASPPPPFMRLLSAFLPESEQARILCT